MRERCWFLIKKLIKLIVIYFNNIKQALQNDVYLYNTFYVICGKNPSLNKKMLHNEGYIRQNVSQSEGKLLQNLQ
jgi:hypothetical protein